MSTETVASYAPAKINLTLDVLGRRDDGFHELRSLVIGIDLCDRLSLNTRPEAGIDFTCDIPALRGPDNLVCRAAELLARHIRVEPAVRIELEKRIPTGAGLGGGSSDAATTLRLLTTLWQAGLSDSELAELGAAIGSDVPLFFSLPGAIITGRGEGVAPVRLRWSGWVLLVFVPVEVPTAAVYKAWRPSHAAHLPRGAEEPIISALAADEIALHLGNHLEAAVFKVSPEVARVHGMVNQSGLGPMRVTGAGSTLYRLFDDKEIADRIAAKVQDLQLGISTAVVAAPTQRGWLIHKEC